MEQEKLDKERDETSQVFMVKAVAEILLVFTR